MQYEIRFSRFVQPACLFQFSDIVSNIQGGSFIGWGGPSGLNRLELLPRKINIPIIDTNTCLAQEPRYFYVVSKRTFCAGSKQSSSVCQNDLGSGLFVQSNGRFFLSGIASLSLSSRYGYCDTNNVAIFTNAHLFVPWIEHNAQFSTSLQTTVTVQPSPLIQTTSEPRHSTPSPIQPQTSNVAPQGECGIMSQSSGLVQGGRKAGDGSFPWATAIYRKNSMAGSFLDYAVGSLISSRHVYIEAIILSVFNTQFSLSIPAANEIKAYVGYDDLARITDRTPYLGASKVIVHPQYKFGLPVQANIAIIVLKNPVQFSNSVFPVCIWNSPPNVDDIIGQNGVTFGYGGQSSVSTTKYKKFLFIKIKEYNVCPAETKFLFRNVRDRSNFFCAGGDGREAPCLGDSASLYLKKGNVWYIIATLVWHNLDIRSRVCRNDKPVMFEHIGPYARWIEKVISTT